MVQQVTTKAEYEKIVKENSKVVVDYFATWCGPCVVIAPFFESLAEKYPNATYIKMDVDKEDLAPIVEQHGVEAMPTFALVKDGEKVKTVVGANKTKLEEAVKEFAA